MDLHVFTGRLRKKWLPISAAALILSVLATPARADSPQPAITQIDVTTYQGGGFQHPAQIALETTNSQLTLPAADRLRKASVPAPNPWGLGMVPQSQNLVYVTDNSNGNLYEMNADTGATIAQITPAIKPSTHLQGVSADSDGTLYLYYNTSDSKAKPPAPGSILHIAKDGRVLDQFNAPTNDGNSLTLRDQYLYLLDGSGTVYKINPAVHATVGTYHLLGSTGHPFKTEDTFSLFFDGTHWNLTVPSADWHVFQYDDNWQYVTAFSMENNSLTGCAYNGKDYFALNIAQGMLYTNRMVDGLVGDGGGGTTSTYQYAGSLRTTDGVTKQFPRYDYNNIMLVYDTATTWTADRFKPYVSYVDTAGVRKGTLFDAFLFCPNGNANLYNNSTYADWSSYLYKTIDAMTALDKEWANRNASLQLSGDAASPAKVFFMLPFPKTSDPLGYREQMLHDFIDLFVRDFKLAHFQNLQLEGFTWLNEEENYSSPIVVNTSSYVHQSGYQMMWIPDMYAWTANDRFDLGVDQLYRQTHYYFDPSASEQHKFFQYALDGARYGTGIELELDDVISTHPELIANFQQTIEYAAEDGLLYASKAWYLENTGLEDLANSKTPAVRTVYELIHSAVAESYRPQNTKWISSADMNNGIYASSQSVNLSLNQKLRITPVDKSPSEIDNVTVHINSGTFAPVSYSGPVGMNEELRFDPNGPQGATVVKQPAGTGGPGVVVGFGQDLRNHASVWFTSDNFQTPSTSATKIEFPLNQQLMRINGAVTPLDTSAILLHDRTMVPVRFAANALGLTVDWKNSTNEVELTSNGKTFLLPVGSANVQVNNELHTLDSPAVMINDRVLVPIRFLSEMIGAHVEWNQDTQTVDITK